MFLLSHSQVCFALNFNITSVAHCPVDPPSYYRQLLLQLLYDECLIFEVICYQGLLILFPSPFVASGTVTVKSTTHLYLAARLMESGIRKVTGTKSSDTSTWSD